MDRNEWFSKLKSDEDAARAQRLVEAKNLAEKSGKEPFDLEVMDALWRDNPDVRSESNGILIPRDERIADWSERYYLQYPNIHTMKEFVSQMIEHQRHGFFD